MITITINQLLAANDALTNLAAQPMPAPAALAVARIIREAARENEIAEKIRYETALNHGSADDNGGLTIKPENLPAFMAELNPFLETTIELNANPVDLAALGNNLLITPKDLYLLEWAIGS